MFIVGSGEYVPKQIVDNEYFAELVGKPASWFHQRTGIQQRRRAAADENLHTMGMAAVQSLKDQGVLLAGVDLIVAASYTPVDTIGTLAHVVQRQFNLPGAKAIYLSTACSSFLDAIDLVSAYFETGRSLRALVIAADHNSAHSRDQDETSGHLWGDGAAAFLLDTDGAHSQFEILDSQTQGLADQGHGPEAVSLNQRSGGLTMPHGREVFSRACKEMTAAVINILSRNGLRVEDVSLLVPHQANKRIIDHVAHELKLPAERVAITIDSLGNTGGASVAITLHRHAHRVAPGEFAVLVTFGGGYSVGAALLRRTGRVGAG